MATSAVRVLLPRACERNVERVVRDVRPTGHKAKAWSGNEYCQWKGWVYFYGKVLPVWGYSNEWAAEPTEWANDTF